MTRYFLILLALVLTGTALAKKSSTSKKSAARSAEFKPTSEEYEVEAGDTLWDISARVAGSPWFWPRVWAYNPEISNPNWIYPGDRIRFYPTNGDLPHVVELIADKRDMPEEVQPETRSSGTHIEAIELPKRRRGTGSSKIFTGIFVTPQEMAESGRLSNAPTDKMLFSSGDEIFVSFPKGASLPKTGQRYMIYHTLKDVQHPTTKKAWGYITEITGFADVTAVENGVARANVVKTVLEVERGQLLTPLVQVPVADLKPVNSDKKVEGVVLAVENDTLTYTGERRLVFVDKGKKDGLVKGNRLGVYLQGDPVMNKQATLPYTEIGQLMVVDAKDNASTCYVLKARNELAAGYTVRTLMQ